MDVDYVSRHMLVTNDILLFQLITPKFPVVIKIGHAHQGMGKVREGDAQNGK